MALGSTQPLTEMSTRNISLAGKGSQCVGLTTVPPSCADCLEIWESQPPGDPQGLSRPVMGLFYPFLFQICVLQLKFSLRSYDKVLENDFCTYVIQRCRATRKLTITNTTCFTKTSY